MRELKLQTRACGAYRRALDLGELPPGGGSTIAASSADTLFLSAKSGNDDVEVNHGRVVAGARRIARPATVVQRQCSAMYSASCNLGTL